MPHELFDVYPIIEALDPVADDSWQVVRETSMGMLVARSRTAGPERVKELAVLNRVRGSVYRFDAHLFLREE